MSHPALPPPPRRSVPGPLPKTWTNPPDQPQTWKQKGKTWGMVAFEKGLVVSDWVGVRANGAAEKMGSKRFYPTRGDFPLEMDKAAQIIKSFTVDGVETEEEVEVKGIKKQRKVFRKIPPQMFKEAAGLAIFTSMRSGLAPFGGAGGAGVVVARLEDGSWSAPSSMSPNNLSTGFMIGVDIYDAILVIRTPEALASFATHKATLGTDIGLAIGPYGAGAAYEAGKEKAPVFSYVKSRGFYAGIQLVGQIFVDRFDENERMYHWPGIKARDILSGKVKVPHEAASLQAALQDAESGRAQTRKHKALDVVVVPDIPDTLVLEDGEVLKLPPTPNADWDASEWDVEEGEIIREGERKRRTMMMSSSVSGWGGEEETEGERREREQDEEEKRRRHVWSMSEDIDAQAIGDRLENVTIGGTEEEVAVVSASTVGEQEGQRPSAPPLLPARRPVLTPESPQNGSVPADQDLKEQEQPEVEVHEKKESWQVPPALPSRTLPPVLPSRNGVPMPALGGELGSSPWASPPVYKEPEHGLEDVKL